MTKRFITLLISLGFFAACNADVPNANPGQDILDNVSSTLEAKEDAKDKDYKSADRSNIESFYLYGNHGCGYCKNAKQFLDERNVAYEFISLMDNPEIMKAIMKSQPSHVYPYVFINGDYQNGEHVGGLTELKELVLAAKSLPQKS